VDKIPTDILKALFQAVPGAFKVVSKHTRTASPARFAAWWFLGAMLIASFPLSVWIYGLSAAKPVQTDPERERKLADVNQKVLELTEALAKANAASQTDRNGSEEKEAKFKERLAKLELQGQQENALLKGKIAALEDLAKRLPANIVKRLMAQGSTTSTPSFASWPDKPGLPAGLDKPSLDLGKAPIESKKNGVTCLQLVGGYGLCDLSSAPPQQ
jgi:hypothetical protein